MHSLPAAYPQQTGQQKQANILILNEKNVLLTNRSGSNYFTIEKLFEYFQ
jgi:hypothetical protein